MNKSDKDTFVGSGSIRPDVSKCTVLMSTLFGRMHRLPIATFAPIFYAVPRCDIDINNVIAVSAASFFPFLGALSPNWESANFDNLRI